MTSRRQRISRLWAAIGLTAALTGAACSADADSDGSAREAGDLTKIVVGVQPVTPFVNVPLGVQEGIFAKHGLDVEVRVISEATTIPPALLADQLQFSNWSYASFTLLADKRMPLRIVGPGDTAGTDLSSDYIQLITMRDSGVSSVKELAGKKIATNALLSLTHIQLMVALDKAGVDPKSVKFVPIPFPNMGAALEAGQVDAAGIAEPFITKLGQRADINPLAALDVAIMPDLPVSAWMTTEKYHKQNPDLVRAFQMALLESSQFAQDNPDKVREFVPEFAGVDKATADKMILPTWVTSVDSAKIQQVADVMHEYGATKKPVDMESYLLPVPLPEKQ